MAVRAAVGLRLQEDEGPASGGAGIPPLIFAKMLFFFFFQGNSGPLNRNHSH